MFHHCTFTAPFNLRYHGATCLVFDLVSDRPSFCHLCLELEGYMLVTFTAYGVSATRLGRDFGSASFFFFPFVLLF